MSKRLVADKQATLPVLRWIVCKEKLEIELSLRACHCEGAGVRADATVLSSNRHHSSTVYSIQELKQGYATQL